MSNPKCAVCGHINRVGAAVCEMCDSRLGAPDDFAAAEGETFDASGGEAREGALPTEIPSPHFKGVGDVIAPTLEVYRKHFPLVGLLVVVATLPLAALQYAALRAMTARADEVMAAGGLLGFTVGTPLLLGLLSVAGSALLSGALVYGVIELQRTGDAGAGECLRRGLKVLPKVFLVSLLYTVVTGVGYILLIVPGVIFSLMYALVIPVAVAENRGPFEAFKRSNELTNGYKGLIFLTYFLWGLLIFVINMIVSGSFAYGGAQDSLTVVLVQALVSGMLASSSTVLTVYIFLGILNEARHGFDDRVITHATESAAR